MSTATKFSHEGGASALSTVIDALAVVPNLFWSLTRAVSAAHAVDRLYHLSDAELAAQGLSRESLGKYICDKYLGD